MTALHVFLRNSIRAFNIVEEDFVPLTHANPSLDLVFHDDSENFVNALPDAELISTWQFKAEWFDRAPNLKAVFTPAAGKDWVAEDPTGRVKVIFGAFHGGMIAESLLGTMLHFNRHMPALLENERQKGWDRNLQFDSRMLSNQRALIVGYGSIGKECAKRLAALGMTVVGYQRSVKDGVDPETGARYITDNSLLDELPRADHVILLLPGDESTHGFMDPQKLGAMKQGSFLYNFGRGTTTLTRDVIWAVDHGPIAGVGLDVTEEEPLPSSSPLWNHPKVLVMPHSSCVYQEYRALHVAELEEKIKAFV